jgi:hypothetical protein
MEVAPGFAAPVDVKTAVIVDAAAQHACELLRN